MAKMIYCSMDCCWCYFTHTVWPLLRQIRLCPGPDAAQAPIARWIPVWTIAFSLVCCTVLNPHTLPMIQRTTAIAYNGIKDTSPLLVSFHRKRINFKQFYLTNFTINILTNKYSDKIKEFWNRKDREDLGIYIFTLLEVYCNSGQVN